MKTRTIILFASLLYGCSCLAQLSVEECHKMARANYPLIKRYDLIGKTEDYSLANISKNYLPQISVNGQASYQSDVTKIPIDFAELGLPINLPEMNKDQYKATIDINQVIWDGGNTSSQKRVAKATNNVERKQVDTGLYSVEDKVNQLFFGILEIRERLKVLDLKETDILANKRVIESMFKNGRAKQSDLDMVDVELLNLQQNREEQLWADRAYRKMLSLFINGDVSDSTVLVKPDDSYPISGNINRPELSLYDSRIALYNAQNTAITAKNMPRLSLFAQGGYGRPGFDMLEDKFKFFAIGGIKLTWNIGNLYTKRNERKLLEVNKRDVEVERESFLFDTNLQSTQELSEIEKYKQLMTKDDEIISLRERVKKASESMFKNGAYKTNDLIRDINAEEQARLSKALHETQYLLNIYKFKHTMGM